MKTNERSFDDIYDFYKLTDDEANSLIGQAVYEKDKMYFPVGLQNEWENYGKKTGLIIVGEIFHWHGSSWCPTPEINNQKINLWFKLGAFSPDDLDIDLQFMNDEVSLRDKIIEFMYTMPWYDTSYHEIFTIIQNEFNAGTLY